MTTNASAPTPTPKPNRTPAPLRDLSRIRHDPETVVKAIAGVVVHGRTVNAVAAELGISWETLQRWLETFCPTPTERHRELRSFNFVLRVCELTEQVIASLERNTAYLASDEFHAKADPKAIIEAGCVLEARAANLLGWLGRDAEGVVPAEDGDRA